mgnify:CR=1 FL=1
MKYIQLRTSGPKGMARDVARHQMVAAKRRCGNSQGELRLTHSDTQGVYYAIFGNPDHAAQFASFCREHTVQHEVLDTLPGGKTVRPTLSTDGLALFLQEGLHNHPGALCDLPLFRGDDERRTP